jgi:hypothetical protein
MTTQPQPPEPTSGPFGIVEMGLDIIMSILGVGGGELTLLGLSQKIDNLRTELCQSVDVLTRFGCRIVRALGRMLNALAAAWQWFQAHVLAKIQKLANKLSRLIDKVLKPYLDFMRKIREAIMRIYNTFFRPIIQLIESLRRVLAILKLFHIKWADRLDRRLARLEGRIMAPIYDLLRHTSIAGSWLNLLLTLKYTLQRPIFVRTLWAYQGDVVRTFWDAQSMFPPAVSGPPTPPAPAPPTSQEIAQEWMDYLTTGGGPLATSIDAGMAQLNGMLQT